MARSTVKDLTVGSPIRLVLGFAAPLLFGFMFQQLYSFVDTAIVGRYLGSTMLAAVGDTGSINFMILGFCQGFCSGFAVPIAQAFGAKDEQSLRRYVANAAYLSGILSVIMAVLTAIFCPTLLRWMNTPEEIIDYSVSYIRLIFIGIPVTVLYNMAGGVLRSLGDSKTPVYFLILASLVNIVLDLLFILVVKLGVAGAALATVISQLLSGVGCLIVMKKRFPILKLSRDDLRVRPAMMAKLAGIGVPMGLQFSITAIGAVVVQWSVNSLSVNAVAAVAAAGKLSMLFSCVFDALATTMATFAGQNMGARKLDRISQGLRSTGIIGSVYCMAATTILWVFGRDLVSLFIDPGQSPEVVEMAAYYLKVNSSMYIPLLFVNIVRLSIQGMGFTQVAMLAGVCEMIARAAVAIFLVPIFQFPGACLANPAAWIAADLFLFPCYYRVMKKVRARLGSPAAA